MVKNIAISAHKKTPFKGVKVQIIERGLGWGAYTSRIITHPSLQTSRFVLRAGLQ